MYILMHTYIHKIYVLFHILCELLNVDNNEYLYISVLAIQKFAHGHIKEVSKLLQYIKSVLMLPLSVSFIGFFPWFVCVSIYMQHPLPGSYKPFKLDV